MTKYDEVMEKLEVTPGCDCDHVNYCIARMYSREMACHKDVYDELTPRIRREIQQIKKRVAKNNK